MLQMPPIPYTIQKSSISKNHLAQNVNSVEISEPRFKRQGVSVSASALYPVNNVALDNPSCFQETQFPPVLNGLAWMI